MLITLLTMLGAGFISIMGTWLLFWLISSSTRNAKFLDFAWPIGFSLAIICYAYFGPADLLKKLVITILVLAWSLRLIWHFITRFQPRMEDLRFIEIELLLGKEMMNLKYLTLCLFLGLIAIILTLPFILVCMYSPEQWHIPEIIALCLWAVAMLFERQADNQLDQFRQDPSNDQKVCTIGLWKYSRHPNYFFEWIIWIAFFLFAMPVKGGALAILSPIIVYILFHRLTIPLSESEALKSKGDVYRDYQKATSPFFPWFRKGK